MTILKGSLLLSIAASSWCPGQAFVGVPPPVGRRSVTPARKHILGDTNSRCSSSASCSIGGSLVSRRTAARVKRPSINFNMVIASGLVTTDRCAAETTFQGEHRVVHIATPAPPAPWLQAEEDEDGDEEQATVGQLVSYFGRVSPERAAELVKFGSVYIGEVVDTSWKHPPSKEKQVTVSAARKKAAKSADQAPFQGTSFEHMKLRRAHPWEAGTIPAHGSYLRVHCDPRMFPRSESTDWSERIVHVDDDYVVLDKPAGVPTVPTVDNGVQNCVFQASLAVAGLPPGSRSRPPPLHAVSRLDVCTSGIVVFARHKESARQLNELFRERKVRKRYLALLTPGPPVPLGPAVHCCRSKAFDGSRRPRIYANYDEELLAGDKWGGAWQDARSTVLLCAPATGAAAAAAVEEDRAAMEAEARALEESPAGVAARLEAELAAGLGLGPGSSLGETERVPRGGRLGDEGGGRRTLDVGEGRGVVPSAAAAAVEGVEGDGVPRLCAMELETGRTHQLRLQLAAMGAAIVGERRYRGVVGRVHRGVREDDDTSKFGQEPEEIALQAARIEFEWKGRTVVYSATRPSWARSDENASP
eukprot:g6887.t1